MPGLPFALALAALCLPFIALGAWFFSTRARTAEGRPGGWLNGMNITLGAILFAVAIVLPSLRIIDRLL